MSAIVDSVFEESAGSIVRLNEVGQFTRGLTYSTDDVLESNNGTIVIRANNLTSSEDVDDYNDIVYVNKVPNAEQILKKGDMVICMANGSSYLVGKNSIYNGCKTQITVGAFCGIYRTTYPLIRWLMQTKMYRRSIFKALQGGNGAIANLNPDDILNLHFTKISKRNETIVYSMLSSIEIKIKDEQDLLIKYNQQRQYLLQQMFI